MLVREAMSAATGRIEIGDTVIQAARRMRDLGLGCLVVTNARKEAVGIVTDRDIMLGLADGFDTASEPVGRILRHQHLITVDPGTDLNVALMIMMTYRVRRLPVLNGARLVGILSAADLASAGIADAALESATPV